MERPENDTVAPALKKNDKEMMADGSVQQRKTTQSKDYLAEKAGDDSQTKNIAGQYLEKTEGGFKDTDSGKIYKDPNSVVKLNKDGLVPDNDYTVRGSNIIKG